MIRRMKKLEIFDIVIYILLAVTAVVTLYPFLNTLAISLNNGGDTMKGGVTIFPRKFTLDNFKVVFQNQRVITAFVLTVSKTVIGTITTVFCTGLFAYGLSKKYLKGRKVYMTLCLITMYFSGGLIPSYILMQKLHLTNNFLVYIIPGLINVWNMIMMMAFFKGIPEEIEESAKIDGAGDYRIFFSIIIPVSIPVIAVMCLYNAVGQWNSWFDAYMYISDIKLYPLQLILRDIINASTISDMLPGAQSAAARTLQNISQVSSRSLTAATMMVTIGPIVFFYPFVQKYFVKGVMIGSVKG